MNAFPLQSEGQTAGDFFFINKIKLRENPRREPRIKGNNP
jgi:hypothetical protein